MEKIKIAEVVAVYPPYGGGLGTVAREHADMLVRDADVTIVTPRYPGKASPQSRHPLVALSPLFAWGNAALVPQAFFLFRKFDVIHFHAPFIGCGLAAVLAKIIWRKKLLVTYHMDLVGRTRVLGSLFLIYQSLIIPLVLAAADRITVTSTSYARASRASWYFNLFSAKTVEIPNTVDTHIFTPGNGLSGQFSRKSFQILFVGGLDHAHYFKGVDILLKASSNINSGVGGTRVFLTIVGDGDLRHSFESLAASLPGLEGAVLFAGRLPDAEALREQYRSCDALVLASTITSEAFGVVLIEAGACQKPVIATRLPGPASVVVEGVTGLLVNPGDVADLAEKIRFLATHPEEAAQMGSAGRQRVEKFYSSRTVAETLRRLIESV